MVSYIRPHRIDPLHLFSIENSRTSTDANFYGLFSGVWHFDQMLLHEGDAAVA